MDGIHDLGGMHGFGPIRVERDEPVFHARWESRMVALQNASGGSFSLNIDRFRHAIERMDPAEYLTAGYYGRWLRAIETQLVEAGELEPGAVERLARELAQRRERDRDAGATIARPAPTPPSERSVPARAPRRPRSRYRREVDRAALFRAGDAVRTRDVHPAGHTRLPRYARGKSGRVESLYAAYVYPDTNAHGLGEDPQYLYCVSFAGDELWGPDAEPGTRMYVDLFEPYLERDGEGAR